MGRNWYVNFMVFCWILGTSNAEEQCPKVDETVLKHRELFHCLLDEYNSNILPKQPVNVSFTLYLARIIDLHEKSHQLSTNGWIHQSWTDPQLVWEPSSFNNIAQVEIPASKIWTPDIVLLNSVSEASPRSLNNMAVVYANGTVSYTPYFVLRSHCNLQMRKYPFDSQICLLKFGSWTYTESQLIIHKTPHNTHQDLFLYEGHEWKITRFRSDPLFDFPDSFHGKYGIVRYAIHMTRKESFYHGMFIGPTVLFSILTCFIFCIPIQHGERITLGALILIGLLLEMTLLDQHISAEMDELPIVGAYMFFIFFMDVFAVLITMGISNIVHKSNNKMSKIPDFARNIILKKLGRIFCVKPEPYTSLLTDGSFTGDKFASSNADDISSIDRQLRSDTDFSNEAPLPKSPTLALEQVLNEIRRYLKLLSEKESNIKNCLMVSSATQSSHRELVISEWLSIATILDRFCFFIYVIIFIFVTIIMLSH